MTKQFTTLLKWKGREEYVCFGYPDTADEISAMFALRYKVYAKYNYINSRLFRDDKDIYDYKKLCKYFIAKIDSRVIGSVRLIFDTYLPTERSCFNFREPKLIQKISRKNRAEVSRLVVDKYQPQRNIYLPRHIIMLGLLKLILIYAIQNRIEGGYSFIKNRLRYKFEKLKMPIHYIKNFQQIYDGELLKPYFNDPQNSVWPCYFLTEELRSYFDTLSEKWSIFTVS